MVNFPCSACGTKLKAEAELVGRRVECPRCASAILVPPALPGVSAKARFPVAKIGIYTALGLVVLLVSLWLSLGHGHRDQAETDFHEDFRNKMIQDLRVIPSSPEAGQLMKSEPEGLRITVPDDDSRRHRETGVHTPFDIRGDFEIVAAYEVLQVDEGRGTTFEIYFQTNTPTREALAFHRSFDPEYKGGHSLARATTDNQGSRQWSSQRSPLMTAAVKSGQLRITRRGADAVLSAAKAGEDFQELFRTPLGTEDVVGLRVGVNPFQARFADVRLVDLRIKGEQIANDKALAAESLPRATPLWVLAGLAALLLGAGGLPIWKNRKGPVSRAHLGVNGAPR
jgi:DNA-directed RNA polymerase subunit RPC12/RpoP